MITLRSSRVDHDPIRVPEEALRYVLLQRTDYLSLPRRPLLYRLLRRVTGRNPLTTAVAIEATCRGGAVRRSFNEDMLREYRDIRPHLPVRARAIADIGCGVGGIDVLLHRHYGRPRGLRFHLVDRTCVNDRLYYGFEERGAFYNSLEMTQRFLVANGIPAEDLRLRDVGEDCRLRVSEQVDLVISLISWGFHYPVRVYVDQVREFIRPGGRVILDVRRGTGGRAELEARFARVWTISESAKKERVVAEA